MLDDAAPVLVLAQEIVDVERRLAEELVAALGLEHQQLALDGADGRGRDIAVFRLQIRGVVRDQRQRRAQVFEIEEEQALFVGDAEDDVQHAFLRVVEIEQTREQQRPHLRNRRAHRMALLAENIPERHGKAVWLIGEADLLRALDEGRLGVAGLREAGEIALHIRKEDGGARIGKALGEALQGDGLAAAGRAGNQPVTVAEGQGQVAIGEVLRAFTAGATDGAYENFARGGVGIVGHVQRGLRENHVSSCENLYHPPRLRISRRFSRAPPCRAPPLANASWRAKFDDEEGNRE